MAFTTYYSCVNEQFAWAVSVFCFVLLFPCDYRFSVTKCVDFPYRYMIILSKLYSLIYLYNTESYIILIAVFKH